MLESHDQVLGIRDKDTCIPIELATLHEHLGKVAFRFLCERLHLEHLRLAAQVAQLYITIAGLRPCRLDAHCQQYIILPDITYANINAMEERLFVEHQLV